MSTNLIHLQAASVWGTPRFSKLKAEYPFRLHRIDYLVTKQWFIIGWTSDMTTAR